jgi:putative chitinase
MLDLATLTEICGTIRDRENARQFLAGVHNYGSRIGLHKPHRLAHFISQTAHEAARFRHDVEVWGPTSAQKRYDTRTDLGNTPQADGDGFRFRGRGPIQITGRANYVRFRDWCRANIDRNAPDFVTDPDAVLRDPWEGLVAVWYFEVTRDLLRYCDEGNVEMVTRRINGGTNGLADRLELYARAALVLLGYGPTGLVVFQKKNRLVADNIAGPKTRAALHAALSKRSSFEAAPLPGMAHVEIPEQDKPAGGLAYIVGVLIALAAATFAGAWEWIAAFFGG